ncbi:MAG: sodium:solute symporter [bacterium]
MKPRSLVPLLPLLLALCTAANAGEPDPAPFRKAFERHVADVLSHVTVPREGGEAGAMEVTLKGLEELEAEDDEATAKALVAVDEGVRSGEETWTVRFAREGQTWAVDEIDFHGRFYGAVGALALAQHLEKNLRDQLVDTELEPDRPTPIHVDLRGFEELAITAERAETSVRVSVAEEQAEGIGTWKVAFELAEPEGEEAEPAKWAVAEIEVPPPEFGRVNYSVLFAYLLAMLGIGLWTSRRIKDTRGFFIAEGRLNFVVVGISILTAYLSALTMMALPGVAFRKLDWTYAVQLPFLVITAFVITRLVLKRYRDAGVISVYEYLEQRIHVSSRLLASFCFILFSIGRMGLVLFLPALAFSMVTGADLLATIVVMGVAVTIYTVLGGMEAVIWTDFAQAIVMMAGAAVSVVYVLGGTGGEDFVRIAGEHHKFRMLAPGLDLTKILTLWLILETIFQTVRIYGTQQDITQRYMTTPSTAKANRSVWIAILGYIPMGFLFYFVGSALFVYYKANPDPAVAALVVNGRADSIYPYFVAQTLPVGLAGLVIAAIFAAAMSSIDACMNASSTVCVEDFYRRFRGRDLPDRHHLKVARWLTVVWGVLATVMAILFINIEYAQIVWGKIMGISTNGVLGLMALAFLPWRVHRWAAVLGFAFSYLVLFAMMWCVQVTPHFAITFPVLVKPGHGLVFLLWPVVGNIACFGAALALDLVLGGPREARRHAEAAGEPGSDD